MSSRAGIDSAHEPVRPIVDGGHLRFQPEPPYASRARDAAGLLATLLDSVLGHDAPRIATILIDTFGSLTAVLAAEGSRIAAVPGMTEAAIRLIQTAHETAVWTAREVLDERALIGSCPQLKRFVRAKLRCRRVEMAYGLFLDRKHRLIRDVLLGEGTIDHVPLYPREVARLAIMLEASGLILVHNHPSGDPTPSVADISMSREIAQALATLNVALHEHVIVGDNKIISLRRPHYIYKTGTR